MLDTYTQLKQKIKELYPLKVRAVVYERIRKIIKLDGNEYILEPMYGCYKELSFNVLNP